jgi:hypothetical protein
VTLYKIETCIDVRSSISVHTPAERTYALVQLPPPTRDRGWLGLQILASPAADIMGREEEECGP